MINRRCLCPRCKEELNEAGRGSSKCQAVTSQPSPAQDVADPYGLSGLKKAMGYIYGIKRWEDARKFTV